MKIGLIGLGKMGLNLALNLRDHGHDVVGYDLSAQIREDASKLGVNCKDSIEELVNVLPERKVIWVMVPAGITTTNVLEEISSIDLGLDAIVIDGGNTNYKETIKHTSLLNDRGVHFLDCGTSGGLKGARNGACLMIGGHEGSFNYLEDVFRDVSCEDGYLYTGDSGSGHYLKMVHNGIEYGMMQAIGEGFEIIEASEFNYKMADVAKVWNHGSVIESWLMELMQAAFEEDPNLDNISGKVDASGEGEWTLESALSLKVPAPVIALSLMMRYRSKQDDTYTGKVVAALRNKFGGHAVHTK